MAKVATSESLRFMVDCLKAAGAGSKPALQQAKLLIEADKIGHPSHGLSRITLYVTDIQEGTCKPNNKPKILKESLVTAWVDANMTLGATSSHFAMDIAIAKARQAGIGWVTVRGANHNGMNAYWSQKASDVGMIGINACNTSPLMAPTRSRKTALGTNPIAVLARGHSDEHFYFHMATTAVALGKIEIQRRKSEPLMPGWAQGPDGRETLDAAVAAKTQCLMPLGGTEERGGYKGYGLGACVEVLTGVLSGATYGHEIRSFLRDKNTKSMPADLSACFVAIDPKFFAPGFKDRLTECMEYWRKMEPTIPGKNVVVPGDFEKKTLKQVETQGYVTYVKNQMEASAALATRLKVKPLKVM